MTAPRDDLDRQILRLHEQGMNGAEITQALGAAIATVNRRTREMGLKPHGRRPQWLLSPREEAALVVSPEPKNIEFNARILHPDTSICSVYDKPPKPAASAPPSPAITPEDVPVAPYVNRLQKAIIYGDVHFGHEDPRAVDLLLQVMREERPEQIIMNGDIVDADVFSLHTKDPAKVVQFRCEQARLRDFLRQQAAAAPGARIVWRDGNHENRIKLRGNETAFAGMPEVSPEAVLYKNEFGIQHLPYDEPNSLWGWQTIIHGKNTKKEAGQLALYHIREYGTSGLNNHDHKRAHIVRRLKSGIEHEWIQNGCLCDLSPDYTPAEPDWKQGFSVFYMAKHYSKARAQLIQIDDGEVVYGGRLLLAA